MWDKLIINVDIKGKNKIQLIFQHGQKIIFAHSFKMFEEDKHQNIQKKIMEMFVNVQLESRLYLDKRKLITAIELGDIKEVKDILY